MTNWQVSEQGLSLIRTYEGFSATAYLCPAGKRTIGYGHVIGAGESFPEVGITLENAEILLKNDVLKAEHTIYSSVLVQITQNQHDALTSFIYNIGSNAFEKSTLLRKINAQAWAAAIAEFGRWIYADGQVLPGLLTRRQAEAAVFAGNKTFTKL